MWACKDQRWRDDGLPSQNSMLGKTAAQWNEFLQAVGDIKEFTCYPRELHSKFKHLRSP